MQRPETRYAKSGEVHIAYQIVGSGPRDLVLTPGFISNLDLHWEEPGYANLLRRLASFARVIQFDKRGTGLSDRVGGIATLEQRMDDVRAVMDHAGSRCATIFGASEGGAMAMLFAATYPKRTQALVLYGSYAHFHTWVLSPEQLARFIANAETTWGTGSSLQSFAPSMLSDPAFCQWWARYERQGASPSAVIALARMNGEIDVRNILPLIRVPTLVLHRAGDPRVKVEAGRYLARNIPGAVYRELAGDRHPIWIGDTGDLTGAVEEFLTGSRSTGNQSRVLATVLALELANATQCAMEFGDSAWDDLLQRYTGMARLHLEHFRGRKIPARHAGTIAAFDGPARAVRCAVAIRADARELGLEVRAGLHAGELALGCDAAGVATVTAAGLAASAAPGEILVSQTVRDLVAGSGLEFRDHAAGNFGDAARALQVLSVDADDPPQPPPQRAPSANTQCLTRREREILRYIARGLTNAEVAAEFELSEHTVKRHVANILGKLGLTTRTAAAALAAREGLS